MIKSVIKTSSLTDGRRMVIKVQEAGWNIKLRADEINTEQSRIWLAINVSMDLLNAYAEVNSSCDSEAMQLQLPCLVL